MNSPTSLRWKCSRRSAISSVDRLQPHSIRLGPLKTVQQKHGQRAFKEGKEGCRGEERAIQVNTVEQGEEAGAREPVSRPSLVYVPSPHRLQCPDAP